MMTITVEAATHHIVLDHRVADQGAIPNIPTPPIQVLVLAMPCQGQGQDQDRCLTRRHPRHLPSIPRLGRLGTRRDLANLRHRVLGSNPVQSPRVSLHLDDHSKVATNAGGWIYCRDFELLFSQVSLLAPPC